MHSVERGIYEVRPGLFKVRVSAGWDDKTKTYRTITRSVTGGIREARAERARLTHGVRTKKVAPLEGRTFASVLDQFIARCEEEGREESTLRNYRFHCQAAKDAFGRRPVANVTTEALEDWYRELGETRSPATVQRYHATIRTALNMAVAKQWIGRNPAIYTSRPSVKKKRLLVPTPQQVRAILVAAEEEDPLLNLFLRLSADTWARRGEVTAVKWEDFRGNDLFIHGAISGVTGEHKGTKTHQNRTVTLGASTVRLVEEFRSEGAEGYVFSDRVDGGSPWSPDTASRGFTRACKAAGVTGVRLHDLRHFGATQALAAGMDIVHVSKRLGHRNVTTTLDEYADWIPSRDHLMADLMDNLLGET